ncbi:MAG: hypothetical protein OK442_04375 [Thaumarchaeota archaeon]|nr:hypothetical protein [Nitrososphaerota archaeon]
MIDDDALDPSTTRLLMVTPVVEAESDPASIMLYPGVPDGTLFEFEATVVGSMIALPGHTPGAVVSVTPLAVIVI